MGVGSMLVYFALRRFNAYIKSRGVSGFFVPEALSVVILSTFFSWICKTLPLYCSVRERGKERERERQGRRGKRLRQRGKIQRWEETEKKIVLGETHAHTQKREDDKERERERMVSVLCPARLAADLRLDRSPRVLPGRFYELDI